MLALDIEHAQLQLTWMLVVLIVSSWRTFINFPAWIASRYALLQHHWLRHLMVQEWKWSFFVIVKADLSIFFDAPPFSLNYIYSALQPANPPGTRLEWKQFSGPIVTPWFDHFHQNQQVCLFAMGTNPNETRLVMCSPRMNNTPVC